MSSSTNEITGDKLISKAMTSAYRDNYDAIFRKFDEEYAKEQCPYCGIMTINPCDEPQNMCEQAINEVHGAWLNDLNSR